MIDLNPVWTKKLGYFELIEFPQQPNLLHCSIFYNDGEDEYSFSFGSWGMDRELITENDCLLTCQLGLDNNANISLSSFADNLEYARVTY